MEEKCAEHIRKAFPPRGRAFESHETACMLNAGLRDAHVRITLFFTILFCASTMTRADWP